MLNFEQKVSTDAEDSQVWLCIVLFTINRYFTCFEAVNLQQTLTVQYSLNDTLTTQIFAWLHTLVKSCSAGLTSPAPTPLITLL